MDSAISYKETIKKVKKKENHIPIGGKTILASTSQNSRNTS